MIILHGPRYHGSAKIQFRWYHATILLPPIIALIGILLLPATK